MNLKADYSDLKIRDYVHWSLFLHENQSYLGRVYLLAKRTENKDFIAINFEEREEFFLIGQRLKVAINNLFAPDKMNYAALGNVFECLHVHFIPRYKSRRDFLEVEFIDKRWGQNYAPYDKGFVLNSIMLNKIKEAIGNELINLE